jgi:hypothetical protein
MQPPNISHRKRHPRVVKVERAKVVGDSFDGFDVCGTQSMQASRHYGSPTSCRLAHQLRWIVWRMRRLGEGNQPELWFEQPNNVWPNGTYRFKL